MAKSINDIPIICKKEMLSCSKRYATVTETASSNEDIILPKPKPVNGYPALRNKGGIIVPNKATKMPHLMKISKLKAVFWVIKVKIITTSNPPKSIKIPR